MATGRLLHPSSVRIELPEKEIANFCARWPIAEFAMFGSVLREDFRPDSDINVLVTFDPGVRHGLFDIAQMELELKELLHRDVMVVTRRGVEMASNPERRKEILDSAEVGMVRRK